MMKNLLFLFCLLVSGASNAEPKYPAFMLVPDSYKEVPGTKYEVPNMPRVRNQGFLGTCHAFAAATLIQKYYCDLKQKPDCANLPLDKEISPIGVLQYTGVNTPSGDFHYNESSPSLLLNAGGAGLVTFINAKHSFSFYRESCFPYDQFVEKFGATKEMTDVTLARLEDFYYKNRYKNRAEADAAEGCEECLIKKILPISEIFPPEKYLENIHVALKKETFGEFLYTSMFSSGCKTIDLPTPTLFIFPDVVKVKVTTKDDIKNKLIEVVKSGLPVSVGEICVAREYKDGCGLHEFIVSGIKQVCDSGKCRELFKVQNSWGQKWQKEFNDGWVDAESILDNIRTPSLDKITLPVLTWIQARP